MIFPKFEVYRVKYVAGHTLWLLAHASRSGGCNMARDMFLGVTWAYYIEDMNEYWLINVHNKTSR